MSRLTMEFSITMFLTIGLASIGLGKAQLTTVNVLQFGATGNGRTDDSQAFINAWKKACGIRAGYVNFVIPGGKTFLLKPVTFEGPCMSTNLHVQVAGTITAPSSTNQWGAQSLTYWLNFYKVNGLIVDGKGTIDGKGSIWWQSASDVFVNKGPDALSFIYCNNLKLDNINIINTPRRHLVIFSANGATITNVNIRSPGDSPNTDGIGISQSTRVEIHYSNIQSGDDCIAVGPGSTYVNISNIACGPGHGISVGSLGLNGKTGTAEQVHVRYCTLTNTQNGVRIKTVQGGFGYARQISFNGITLVNVQNPIIIDQYYCPHYECTNKGNSNVKVSDISFIGVHGTSATQDAINLSCSRSAGCTNIVLNHINIRSTANSNSAVSSSCINAHGRVSDSYPPVNCLLQ